jgi:Lrp/AsnC family leucine-responsive transcriptional regulator
MAISLTALDHRLLRSLAEDGRISNKELAQRLGISESACLRRMHALEREGVITGYRAIIDPKAVGRMLSAYVLVNLDQRGETDAQPFLESIRSDPRIAHCAAITGTHDLILTVQVRDVADLTNLTMDTLLKLPTVRDLTTCLVLREYKVAPA